MQNSLCLFACWPSPTACVCACVCVCVCVCVFEAQCTGINYFLHFSFWQCCSIIKPISLGGIYVTCVHFLCSFYRSKYKKKVLFALGSTIAPLPLLSFFRRFFLPLAIAIKHKQIKDFQHNFLQLG